MTKTVCFSVCSGLLLFLASCSNEFQPAEEAGGGSRAVGFSAITGKQSVTRAATITTANIANFKVYGYESGGTDFIAHLGGADVSGTAGSGPWTYSPVADWPDGAVTFNAYAPSAQFEFGSGTPKTNVPAAVVTAPANTAAGGDLKTLGYTVPDAMNAQTDLLVASATQAWSAGNNTVTMHFKHALSRLLFKGKLVSTGATVGITHIQLLNLKMAGTLDMTTAATTIAWAPTAGSELKSGANEAPWEVIPNAAAVAIPLTYTGDYEDVLVGDSGVMVLPQPTVFGTSKYGASQAELDAALATDAFYVALTWKTSAGVEKTSLCAVPAAASNPQPAPGAAGIAFEAGKQYTLQFTLDAETNFIEVDAVTVLPFDPGTGDVMDANIGAVVGKVAWAKNDVGVPGVFAADNTPGYGYQLNRLVGWTVTAPPAGYNASGVMLATAFPVNSGETAGGWTANPCPDGWRIPTNGEFTALYAATTAHTATSGWAEWTVPTATSDGPDDHKLRFALQGYIQGTSGNITSAGQGFYCTIDGTASSRLANITAAGALNSTWASATNSYAYPVRCVKDLP